MNPTDLTYPELTPSQVMDSVLQTVPKYPFGADDTHPHFSPKNNDSPDSPSDSLAPSSEDSEASSSHHELDELRTSQNHKNSLLLSTSFHSRSRRHSLKSSFNSGSNTPHRNPLTPHNHVSFQQEQRVLNIQEVFREMFNPNELDGGNSEREKLETNAEDDYRQIFSQPNDSYPLYLKESYCLDSILFKYRRNNRKNITSERIKRKAILIRDICSFFCFKLINWSGFRLLISSIIFLNLSVYIYKSLKQESLEDFYLIIVPIYVLEIFAVFCGVGPRSFVRNPSNIIDSIIIIGLFLTIFFKDLKNHSMVTFFQMPLRVFRLPTLLKLRNLSNILEGIISSVRVLGETMWFLGIFCSFYALAGLQLFSGVLKNRCFDQMTGMLTNTQKDILCGNVQCEGSTYCAKSLWNPERDSTNFDNFLASFIQVLRVITFDNWTDLMNLAQRGLTNYASIYFISLALLGNFFILNFFLAVLKVRFDAFQHKLELNSEGPKLLTYDIRKLRTLGVYYRKSTIMANNKRGSVRRASVSYSEFEKTVMSFIRKKVYNFEDNKIMNEDQDLRQNLQNRLFIVDVKKRFKYFSSSKLDVVPQRKELHHLKELEELKIKSRKNKIKGSFLSNATIYKENMKQIEKKVLDLAENVRKFSKKPSQRLENLRRLCDDYENFEKMSPKNSSHASPSVFAVNKQPNQGLNHQKTTNPLWNKLLSNNLNESVSFSIYNNSSLSSSFNQLNPLIRIKTTKPIDSDSQNLSESMLLNPLPDNRTRAKSSPNRILLDKNRGNRTNKLSNTSNPSVDTPIPSCQLDNSANSKRSFIKKLDSNILSKRRGSFAIAESKKQEEEKENNKQSSRFISLSSQKTMKSNGKMPIFAGKRSTTKNSMKTSQIFSKNSHFLLLKKTTIKNPTPTDHNAFSVYLDNMKKKDFGFQKLLEKKYNISLRNGVKLTYEQAKIILNDPLEEEPLRFFDNEKKYFKIFQKDYERKKFTGSIWSGGDLEISLSLPRLKKVLIALSYLDYEIWRKGLKGKLGWVRRMLRKGMEKQIWQIFTNATIIGYLILLCLEGFIDDTLWGELNVPFMVFFTLETLMKLFVFGVSNYFRDSINILDFSCQILFIADFMQFYVIYDIDSKDGLGFIAVFRGLYPLKMLRLMLNSLYIRAIGHIIHETIRYFISISLLLSFLILLYALYGMQIYSQYYIESYDTQMSNFHDITSAVGTVFLIINFVWVSCFQTLFGSGANFYSLSFYSTSLIFFGHLIVLNLFIALMLRGFEVSEDEGEFEKKEEPQESIQSEEDSTKKSIKNLENIESSESDNNSSDKSNSKTHSDCFLDHDSENVNHNGFFLLKKTAWARKMVLALIKSKPYKKFTKFMTLMTLVSLALETYDGYETAVLSLKFIINGFFLSDLIMNSLFFGFFGKNSDLIQKVLNVIEIMVISAFLLQLLIPDSNNHLIIQIMGMLRLIRPIRLIKEIKGMWQVVNSIILSLGGLIKVFLIVFMVWLMFAISGMKIFRNKFGYCSLPSNFQISESQCLPPNEWTTYQFNFDNSLNGILVLFIIATFDDEVNNIVQVAINADTPQNGPQIYKHQIIAFFFLWAFIVIGVWFFLNLFIGVVFMNFKITQKANKNPDLTEGQIQWIEMEKVLSNENPYNVQRNSGTSTYLRGLAHRLLKSNVHRWVIVLTSGILFVMLVLNNDPPIIKDYERFLDYLTLVLTTIYVYETMMKMVYHGVLEYFNERWIGQFLITVIYILSSLTIFLKPVGALDGLDPKYLRLFSLLKLAGLFRILERLKSLKRLFITLKFHSHNIKNILFLFLLTLTIYTVIGCYLFKDVKEGKIINDYVNFKNFLYGMMTLVRCFTANSWPNIMKDAGKTDEQCQENVDCGSRFAPIFFISYVFITQMILSNLLIMVLLEEFEYFSKNPKNPVLIFYQNLGDFKKIWAEYTLKKRVKTSDLFAFLRLLGPPLGVKRNADFITLGRKVKKMILITDNKGVITFHNLLHALMKNYVLDEVYKNNGEGINKKAKVELKKHEKKFFKSLQRKNERIYRQIFTFHKKFKQNNSKEKYFPVKCLFYCHLVFSLWMKFPESLKKKKKEVKIMKNDENGKIENSPKSQFFKENQNSKLFKLANNCDFPLLEQKKERFQSVIYEQEEENEEKKPIFKFNKFGGEAKRMTLNKIKISPQTSRMKKGSL